MNITTEENRAKFKDTLTSGSLDRKEVCACACACSCALARQGGWVGACSLDRKEVSVRKECVRVSLSLSLSLSLHGARDTRPRAAPLLHLPPLLAQHPTPANRTASSAARTGPGRTRRRGTARGAVLRLCALFARARSR